MLSQINSNKINLIIEDNTREGEDYENLSGKARKMKGTEMRGRVEYEADKIE